MNPNTQEKYFEHIRDWEAEYEQLQEIIQNNQNNRNPNIGSQINEIN